MIGASLVENPKKFWSYVKQNKSENIGIPPLKTEQGVSVTDKDKAETLNSYFFSVFTKEKLPLPNMPESPYGPLRTSRLATYKYHLRESQNNCLSSNLEKHVAQMNFQHVF